MAKQLRQIDYYELHSTKIQELDRYIRQIAPKGHGHQKLRNQAHRIYRSGSRPTGFHDYHNLQWDPSIFRGRTFRDFREKNLSPSATTVNMNKFCCYGCNSSKSMMPMNRRKTVVELPRLKVGGVFRPTTDEIIFEESSGRKRHKSDESKREMLPYIVEQLEPPEYKETCTQSDEIKEALKRKCHHIAIGNSTSTQVDVSIVGTGNHEDPLVPIMSKIGTKVLEQSLLETFEEYELHSIRSEIRSFMQKRSYRQAREMKHVQDYLHKQLVLEYDKVRREKDLQKELEAEEVIAAILFSISVCNDVVANTFSNLRLHKLLADETHDAEVLKPWMHEQMYRHLQVPRMIINDMIQTVENDKVTKYKSNKLENTEKIQSEEEEEEDYSSFGPPPNTASSIPYSASEGEEDYGK